MPNFRSLIKRADALLAQTETIAKPERGVVRTWADLMLYRHLTPEKRRKRFGGGPYTVARCFARLAGLIRVDKEPTP